MFLSWTALFSLTISPFMLNITFLDTYVVTVLGGLLGPAIKWFLVKNDMALSILGKDCICKFKPLSL